MRYLGLALFAEGTTDHLFLRPLLRRLCEDLCARHGVSPIEVSDVLELHSPTRVQDQSREIRIAEAARDASGAWQVLFVHADGGGKPEQAHIERVEPATRRVAEEGIGRESSTVPVIPVRETEAWALADGETLRQIFGSRLDDRALGLPSSVARLESVTDPKKLLESVYTVAVGQSRRRRRSSTAIYLESIGERIPLGVLRRLPAFSSLETMLRTALGRLHYLYA